MLPSCQSAAGVKYNSPYLICESAAYVMKLDPSTDAPLVTRKLVHALPTVLAINSINDNVTTFSLVMF